MNCFKNNLQCSTLLIIKEIQITVRLVLLIKLEKVFKTNIELT